MVPLWYQYKKEECPMVFCSSIYNFLGFKEHALHESSLSRIWQHSQERTIGIVTGFRGERSLPENLAVNRKIENEIRAAGLGFVHVQGHYTENIGTPDAKKVVEKSFLVISTANDNGKLKGFLKKVAKFSNPVQDSVLYKEAGKKAVLIGTSPKNSWPAYGQEAVIGDWRPNKIADFYTKMRGHRSFTFESVEGDPNIFTMAYKKRFI